MIKEASYKQRFSMVMEFLPLIIETIKRELKGDHLRQNRKFCAHYFPSRHLVKMTTAELHDGYARALESSEHSEQVGEYIAQRWLVKKAEIYNFFEKQLTAISNDFSELQEIDTPVAQEIARLSIEQFGPIDTLLFATLNAVVFPQELFSSLKLKALDTLQQKGSASSKSKDESENLRTDIKHDEQNCSRLVEKYEEKLSQLRKLYHRDVDRLKKQIATLHKQLQTLNDKQ